MSANMVLYSVRLDYSLCVPRSHLMAANVIYTTKLGRLTTAD